MKMETPKILMIPQKCLHDFAVQWSFHDGHTVYRQKKTVYISLNKFRIFHVYFEQVPAVILEFIPMS